eukprot:2930185-Prorocentrum_lima.AAC.1
MGAASPGHGQDQAVTGEKNIRRPTLNVAGLWVRGKWTTYPKSANAGLAGWHTREEPKHEAMPDSH